MTYEFHIEKLENNAWHYNNRKSEWRNLESVIEH